MLCLVAVVLAPAASAQAVYPFGKQNMIMFPVKNGIGEDKAQMADDLLLLLKDGLSKSGRFLVVAYDVNSNVSAQRAVAEQKIKAEEARTFSTDATGALRAQKICQAAGTDLGLVASLDSYTFNEATKEAKIGVTVKIVSANPDVEPIAITVVGASAGKLDDSSQSESGIAIGALDDAAQTILAKAVDAAGSIMAAEPIRQDQRVYVPAAKSKSHSKGIWPAMLGALLLGLALSGN